MTVHVVSKRLFLPTLLLVVFALLIGTSPAFAAGEPHPFLFSFERSSGVPFSDPNGIAIDEAGGNVYVADIGTNTVYKSDTAGKPVNFTEGSGAGTNALTGAATPAGSFSFPGTEKDTPAALAVDNSTSPLDPSQGDLYVMDAGHGVIDKFTPEGKYLSQIPGFNPAGSGELELLGLAIDANGTVHVDVSVPSSVTQSESIAIDEFDDSTANGLIAKQINRISFSAGSGLPLGLQEAQGLAVGSTGDDYLLYGNSCTCVGKTGQQLAGLGIVDPSKVVESTKSDVAVAADPASGHVFIDQQSSVGEWDTGAMNGSPINPQKPEPESEGSLVTRFGSEPGQLSSSPGEQGGLAVDGMTGEIYISNPANGKVYIFGSDAPVVTVGAPRNITTEAATLNGAVNPRGTLISACRFEYGVADEYGQGTYKQEASCNQAPSGTTLIPISANISGLRAGQLYRFRLKVVSSSGDNESSGLIATPGEGFGIKNFEMSFLNENGTPDTQAGSHPYALVNVTEFNSHYVRKESTADSPYMREPDGTLKDLRVDLPPGLVGDPNAIKKKCTLNNLDENNKGGVIGCPGESQLGVWVLAASHHAAENKYLEKFKEPVFDMVPPFGVALQLGAQFVDPDLFINNGLFAGGNYPIETTLSDIPPAAPVLVSNLTIYGVVPNCVYVEPKNGKYKDDVCRERGTEEPGGTAGPYEVEPGGKPFLTLPTACNGPLRSSITIDSYQEPGRWIKPVEALSRNATTKQPVSLTGCSKLQFPPEISAAPDTTDASSSSGLTVHVKVPQTAASNPEGLAESALRDTTVTLPVGVAINPSGGNGLEACSEGLAGFLGMKELNGESEHGVQTATFTPTALEQLQPGTSFCPNGSKIGTVKLKTPLLEHELEGAVYLGAQNANPFGSLIAMYMMVEDPFSGSTVKLTGEVRLTETGQIVTTFKNTPDLPFEDLEIHFFGGERAPLTTPSRCGTYATTAVFTPWDGNAPVSSESSFNIDHGPNGGPCPGAKLPFNPTFTGGATNLQAGGFTPLTGTFSREDGEQQIARLHFTLPPGLSGVLTGVKLCGEEDANAGTCGAESLIGETTVAAGVGSDPVTVTGGKVYLTGPYKGAPFGLSVVEPVKAGPFDLEHDTSNPSQNPACDCAVVRAKLEIDPLTAAVTITSNKESEGFAIPHMIDGIPVELKKINFTTTRSGFQFNPTNCEKLAISGSAESDEGETRPVQVPFQVTNCAALKFKPSFKVTTSGKTSRAMGASLHADLSYPKAPFGSQANVRSVKVNLPRQLPSRLTTLQKACPVRVFSANPAACPAASRVGSAKAITPILPVPLQGPAYFVSHGGAQFPELILVLQGYGITIDLHGETFINEKTNITSSTYRAVPDQPVTSFELTLPQGPNSALAANGNLCRPTKTVFVKRRVHGHLRRVRKSVVTPLVMPTVFTAQNGATIHQNTRISVTGCGKARPKRASKHKPSPKKK